MAKRFTDTEKWKKPMIRKMKAAYKLLWLYILDECDHAGIWHVDFEVAQIKIGEKLKETEAIKSFGEKIHVFDGGNKWFIPDFLEFQYGELNEKNRAHQSVLKILDKYGLIGFNNKPLISPLQGAMDKDMDKEKEMDKDFGKSENLFEPEGIVPQMVSQFKQLNPKYPEDRERDFAAVREIAEKIAKWEGLPAEITDPGVTDHIKLRWGELVNHAKADGHLSRYSLTQINKHFQSIVQSFTNGQTHIRNNSTGAKLGTSEARIKTAEKWGR